MLNRFIQLICFFFLYAITTFSFDTAAQENKTYQEAVTINLTIPQLKASPYHRPYVAVWLETEKRKGVHTIAVWYEQDDWLKDMRQWWRKLGKKGKHQFDAVSSATKKPNQYRINWDFKDSSNQLIPAGTYYLNFEASREEGGRDFLRQKISIGKNQSQSFELKGDYELGPISIAINPI
ncbi:DUF2271 domain-containing protein [Aliikangiella sp. IMCC44359]|uniref:DUF2271 domain-containing protein n=1 Tax=Aliikangiella sp. IMCC44359 TaxID=3459125 RepID=UPI00403B0133